MPAQRLTMRKTREILRLKWGLGLSTREIGRSCRISPTTVSNCVARAEVAGLKWPLPEELDDAALERLLYPTPRSSRAARPAPDFRRVYRELKRKGVTLELLWQEYKASHPEEGYQYSAFCAGYRRWRGKLDVVMRQEHRAGERLYVDYAGQTMEVIDPKTGEVTEHVIFVATLGASNYTYAEAQTSYGLRNWVAGHIRAFEAFGGCPEVVVPDNLKAGVKRPCFYEPDLNPTYHELAKHYGVAVIPARVRRPKDKAKVENAVQQVSRWVLAPLRKQRFFGLHELNEAIWKRLEWLNNRPLSKLDGTRQSLFEELDRPALKPLPQRRYVVAVWKTKVAVNIDYHIEYERNYYSVPHQLVRKRVDVRASDTTVECFYRGRRVASHLRSYKRGRAVTEHTHRPKSHRKYAEWSPSRLVRWAESVGPHVGRVVAHILESKPHPEQGYRSCLGIIRLGKRYTPERLDAACKRALDIGGISYRSVQSILKTGLDQQPVQAPQQDLNLDHPNIRGSNYYH